MSDEEKPIEDGDEKGYFGGLTGAEARQRRTEKEQRERELEKLDPQTRIITALTEKACLGNPQAARELRELGVLQASEHRTQDQALLALLTSEQRLCIQAALSGEKVEPDLAREAWC